jgi:hypothetical protein
MAETPRYAHLIALLFLGSGFVIFVCLLVAVVAALRKAGKVAKFAASGAALTALGYTVVLFGVALATSNKTLPPGDWKYFCEADCHIAYSVDSVQEAATLGPEAKPITTRGRFVVVRLKTWFDENSISPSRGNFPLTPDSRTVKLIDDRGRQYLPAPEASAVLPGTSAPLNTPLRPGESYLTTFVFDVPADARNPRLLISDVDLVTRLLVDHENSPLHGKIYLALNPTASTTVSDLQ